MNKHKWQKIKQNVVFKSKRIGTIYKDDVIFPSGKKGTFEYLKKKPFVAIIAKTKKDKIILVGQHRYSVGKFSWEIPEGSIDTVDTPLISAKKELEEEAGLKAKKWKLLGKFVIGTGSYNQLGYVYLAKDLYPGQQQPESSGEIQEVKDVTLKEFDQMVKSKKIFEGPTLAAMYLAKNYLK